MARTRLTSLLQTLPCELGARETLAAVYRLEGNSLEAGRWSYLADERIPEEIEAFERACGRDPIRLMRALRWRGPEAAAATEAAPPTEENAQVPIVELPPLNIEATAVTAAPRAAARRRSLSPPPSSGPPPSSPRTTSHLGAASFGFAASSPTSSTPPFRSPTAGAPPTPSTRAAPPPPSAPAASSVAAVVEVWEMHPRPGVQPI